ncbi:hypothetical protein [Parachlamydia sp. AcF125]|uniref:hypothetical protein n=1 Tax=Parachlamydia sp. AcF125 TaxID=2795736 RepID=UPI001BC9A917|nr:hypothetical protein [Parachlamydia sp. AcF125]MBS4168376.1 hypothetical protein [Parachlamydia sp. AcF125]
MSMQDFPEVQRFEKLGDSDWETLKRKYVMDIQPGEPPLQATQQMQACIRDRDVVDYASYREAILRIFPANYFNLAAEIAGSIAKTAEGGYTFTSVWYQFIVTQKTARLPTGLESSEKCLIAIKAPGSRKLTSDIDTSIHTLFKGKSSFFDCVAERIKVKGPDFEGRITNAVIEGFYSISEELFKMTSSSHRDSNAYLDTLANDQENYPKFLNNEENNPSIQGARLFSDEEFTQKFKEYKHAKHVQEIAASLFSLRQSLEEEEWQVFKELVKQVLSEILKELSETLPSELSEDSLEAHILPCQQDCDTIFQEVESFHNRHQVVLEKKTQELRRLDPLPVREQDISIAALNRLYVEYLEKCATCHEKILNLRKEKKPLIDQLGEEKAKLHKVKAVLERLGGESDDEDTQELIEKKQREYALAEKKYRQLQEALHENLIRTAQLQVDYHRHQILASTFANEAYVCRSAVYHVVKGQSGVKDFSLSQQILLGSALQQVGFKLLHTKEFLHKNKSPEEVAYYTAKYGQRLFNLVFNGRDAALNDVIIQYLAQGRIGKGLPKFTYLKSEEVRGNAYPTLGQEELALLNSQVKIIQHIKFNPHISDAEKPKKTLELIQSAGQQKLDFENEKKLYLSLSAKLIGLVYASRLEQKGYLWGGNPRIPLLTQAVKEEIEGSTSVISSTAPLHSLPPLGPTTRGIAVDIGRQLDERAIGMVMGAQQAWARDAVQKGDTFSLVGGGYSGETVRGIAADLRKNSPK